jgi:hypothetical protein
MDSLIKYLELEEKEKEIKKFKLMWKYGKLLLIKIRWFWRIRN